MKKVTYFLFIHLDEDGIWGEFPDLKGCATVGDDIESLLSNASNALESYIESMIDNNQTLPAPATATELKEQAKNSNVTFVVPIIGCLPDEPARINITSTVSKIEEITRFAKKTGKTRSELMVTATLNYIRKI